jgi:hypothetical protein
MGVWAFRKGGDVNSDLDRGRSEFAFAHSAGSLLRPYASTPLRPYAANAPTPLKVFL